MTGSYTYDGDGNALTATGTTTFTNTISPTSNQLNTVAGTHPSTNHFDAAGNLTSYTGSNFTYNQQGRMTARTVSTGSSNYYYNALDQFISRQGIGGNLYLVYDQFGHILGEYNPQSSSLPWQETIWLGDIPVATIRPNGTSVAINYVHADHLGTPRKVTRSSDNALLWRWDPATLGTPQPNQNPSGLGAFVYNLRFPGQFYLGESTNHINGYRHYDNYLGRYLESDPIGLRGGVNTYAYAKNNPLSHTDPTGLFSLDYTVSERMVEAQELDPWWVRAGASVGLVGTHGGRTQDHNLTTCTCKPQCNSWTLEGCHETIALTVLIRTDMSPNMQAQARAFEGQHVDDYKAAAGQIYAAGAAAERVQKAITYSDKQSCENAAASAVGFATLPRIQATDDASKRRYDDSGLHTIVP